MDAKPLTAAEIEQHHQTILSSIHVEQVARAGLKLLDHIAAQAATIARLEGERDNPEMDATDAAHPAWWRGNERGVAVICQRVAEILDGKDKGAGVASAPWEPIRRRLLELAARPAADPYTREQKLHDVATLNDAAVEFRNQAAAGDKHAEAYAEEVEGVKVRLAASATLAPAEGAEQR